VSRPAQRFLADEFGTAVVKAMGHCTRQQLTGKLASLKVGTGINVLFSPTARLVAEVSGGLPRRADHHLKKLRLHFPDSGNRQLGLPEVRETSTQHNEEGLMNSAKFDRLLVAVRRNPDKLGPRLVLAHWLEHRGDPRGTLIRFQCLASHRPRSGARRPEFDQAAAELLARHRATWLGQLAEVAEWVGFQSGFVHARVPADLLTTNAVLRSPAAPWLEGLAVLWTCEGKVPPPLPWSLMHRATSLQLWNYPLGDEGAARLAADGEARPSSLWLGGCAVGPTGVAAFAGSQRMAMLRDLQMPDCPLGDEGCEAFAASRHWRRLRAVNLCNTGIRRPGLRLLAGSPALRGLTRFWLAHNNLGPDALEDLLEATFASRLIDLDLVNTGLDNRAWRQSLAARLIRLLTLDVSRNQLGDDFVKGLASSPPGRLRHLFLEEIGASDESALALADSEVLARLRRLRLRWNQISPAGRRALQASGYLAGCKIEVDEDGGHPNRSQI
jgi:uncharacterized protein (TIGR02996 family)